MAYGAIRVKFGLIQKRTFDVLQKPDNLKSYRQLKDETSPNCGGPRAPMRLSFPSSAACFRGEKVAVSQ